MSDVKRLESAINIVTAKPLAWILIWLWLAVRYGCRSVERCARWIRERWVGWRTKGKVNGTPVDHAELLTRRVSKRQAA